MRFPGFGADASLDSHSHDYRTPDRLQLSREAVRPAYDEADCYRDCMAASPGESRRNRRFAIFCVAACY